MIWVSSDPKKAGHVSVLAASVMEAVQPLAPKIGCIGMAYVTIESVAFKFQL
jgi:hypothetical protein